MITEQQIRALAPDDASAKAGASLARKENWVELGMHPDALWGLCKGSGQNPYQTQVDLSDLAAKCSCPSRKFPCKHSIGLLLLYAASPAAFPQKPAPEWVAGWLSKRKEATKTPAGESAARQKAPDAAAKRADARIQKVSSGIEALKLWLADVGREGLVSYRDKPAAYWQDQARRMVDAQCPGLAARFLDIASLATPGIDSGDDALIRHLAAMALLAESWPRLSSLPEAMQHEVRTQIGFPQSKELALTQEGLADSWLILAKTARIEQKLMVERYWLYGKSSGQFGLFIQYIAPGQAETVRLAPGTEVRGTWVYYPGLVQLRGLFKEMAVPQTAQKTSMKGSLEEAVQSASRIWSANPFAGPVPVWVTATCLGWQDGQPALMGADGVWVPAHLSEDARWKVLALTGGGYCDFFCLANPDAWEIGGVWVENTYYPILIP